MTMEPDIAEVPDDDSYPPDDERNEDLIQQMRTRSRGQGPVPRGRSSRLLAKERQKRALELRKAGSTYDAIAQALGYSDATGARAAVIRAFDQIILEPAVELRTMQMERYNHMLLTLWTKVQAGDERAIGTALGIMDRINSLAGIEAPKQVQVDHTIEGAVLIIDGDKDSYVAHMKRMAGIEERTAKSLPTGGAPVMPYPDIHQGDDDGITDAEVIEDTVIVQPVKGKAKPRTSISMTVEPEEDK